MYDIYHQLNCMTEVSFYETTRAIHMDDEWWNDHIQVIFDFYFHKFLIKTYNKLILIVFFLFRKYLMLQSFGQILRRY